MIRTLSLLCATALLSACTLFHPPAYNLPSDAGLVAGKSITVRAGENLYTIAQKNGVKLNEIIVVNNMKPPYRVKAGDTISLPERGSFYGAPPPQAAPVEFVDRKPLHASSSDAVTVTPLEPLTSAPVVSSAPLAKEPSVDVKTESVASAPMPEKIIPEVAAPSAPVTPTQSGVPAFTWPVRGTVISAFGPKGKGQDNDGVNIAAPKGAPVKAAEGGTVVYADNKMKGFGNLVLVRHEGGWVTAYAHLGRMVVARDSIVAKGDMIGTVGTTGGVASPQLHFETRRDGKPTDPELVVR